MAFYAWSPIQAGDKSAKFGDSVTASKLGVSEDDFDAMVASGAVRTVKPPEMPKNYQGSVMDFYRLKAREAELAAGASVDEAALAAHHASLSGGVVEETEEVK